MPARPNGRTLSKSSQYRRPGRGGTVRILGAIGIAALWVLAPAAPAGGQVDPAPLETGSGSSPTPAATEADFVGTINALRSSLGLPSLTVHPNLVGKARSWANTMSGDGHIWHSTLAQGITVDWKELGENVGMGPSVASLHGAFVASPSHYANLVRPDYMYVGVGVAVNPDGTIFVAEEFMVLQPAPEAEAAAASASGASAADPAAENGDVTAPAENGDATAPSADALASPDDAGATVDHLEALLLRLRALDG